MKKILTFICMLTLFGQTMQSQDAMNGLVQTYFNELKAGSDFASGDLSQWQITDVVPSLNPEIQHVYVQQYHEGIPIQYAAYKLTVKNGNVTWHIDQFVRGVSEKVNVRTASISAQSAVTKTAAKHNLDIPSFLDARTVDGVLEIHDDKVSLEPIKVKPYYYLYEGSLRLVWNVSYYQKDGTHWWNENVDAVTGKILRTEDWVITCNWGGDHADHKHDREGLNEVIPVVEGPANFMAGESYTVYAMPVESPLYGGRTVVNEPQNLTASPFGWHDTNGVAGAEFTNTRGNNVWAQEDTNGNDGIGFAPDGGSGLDFNFPINLSNQPGDYQPAAITNLFYWNNIMHDVWYQYGFDEASGNFQENNYGNGGVGGDSVNADAQDGSGINNANFATPPEGANPRMQMFLWNLTNPQRDGDLDNGIIAHEYGHGISIRLVGGPSTNVLGGAEQMGEGWSDWFGLMLTMVNSDQGTDARGIGNYALGQTTAGGGIRPTPYSTNTAINGTTYADINGLAVPHGVGYAFATILWDMTWALIDQEGFDSDFYNGTGGNNIAMALVIEGLKNTANNPGFVSGRDGILQADQDLYGGQYNCIIWDTFAARGVGVDAVENTNGGFNGNNDQTVSFTTGCVADTQPPTAPTNLQASNITDSSLTLTWTASTDNVAVTGYEVFQDGVSIGTTANTQMDVTGLFPETTYDYYVIAFDAEANESAPSNTISPTTLPDSTPPSTPIGLSVFNVTADSVFLVWTGSSDNVGVTGYNVYQDGVFVGSTASTSFNVTGLDSDTTYGFYIEAFDAEGNISNPSNTVFATTLLGLDCSTSVTIPYSEGFETGFGLWQQSNSDSLDWTRNSGSTPTAGTGPSSGSNSTWYLYVEANDIGPLFRNAILNSPCIDLITATTAFFSFDYHMNGDSSDIGRFGLQVTTDDGATWTTLWHNGSSQGNQWNTVNVDLQLYTGREIALRFHRRLGSSDVADVAIDNINLSSGSGPLYCPSSGGDNGVGYINSVRIQSISNASGDGNGYTDFTNLSTPLVSSNIMQISSVWPGARPNIGYAVYIDWNQDGDFNDFFELAYSTQVFSLFPVQATINVPFSAIPGPTRMRVSAKHAGIPGPCEDFFSGEVEDYTVIVPTSLVGKNGDTQLQLSGNTNTTSEFVLYPNPVADGDLFIDMKGEQAAHFVLYNANGQQIRVGELSGSSSLDVSALPSGLYFVELQSESTKWIGKFIKE
ncbi:MAG: M36 family metallopeptidase [Flavobacteriaceae bacterium]|nr:M36 family metallopeptidase [Flavobacteriaceae bacterium]